MALSVAFFLGTLGCSGNDRPPVKDPNGSGNGSGGSGDVVDDGGVVDADDGGSTGEPDGGGSTGDVDSGGTDGGDTIDDGGGGTTGDADGGGTTGDGGTTSDGGGGNGSLKTCKRECSSPSDCLASGEENEDNWECTDGVCEPNYCTTDAECTPRLSGWQDEGCSADGCFAGFVCVQQGDTTWCASKPTGGECDDDFSELQRTPAGGGDDVTVCGTEGACNSGSCAPSGSGGCDSDFDCPGGAVCHTVFEKCECPDNGCNSGWACVER